MFRIAVIIPTGLAAATGGFAGDASPVVRLLAAVADEVLTHPNAVNAAGFYTAPANVLYSEGYFLDRFFMQQLGFCRSFSQAIALVIDRRCQPLLSLIENAVHATCVTFGCRVIGYQWTHEAVDIQFAPSPYGYQGQVRNADTLLAAAQEGLAQGATALAVLTYMDLLAPEQETPYLQAGAVDPIGATEALISHFLAAELGVPVAHSPIFEPHLTRERVDPRVAAEEIGTTYLPCVLMGLARAPRPVPLDQADFRLGDIQAVVAPWDCLGGIPMLAALEHGIPLIAVRANTTCLDVTLARLGITAAAPVYIVENYLEAVGLLLALKQGLDPEAIKRPFTADLRAF